MSKEQFHLNLEAYWYDQIMTKDSELSSYEKLIDRLESQIRGKNPEISAPLRAALSEARVLANAVRIERDYAIDQYEVHREKGGPNG